MKSLLLTYILFVNFIFSNVSLTIESLTTQNEYFTTNSGIELLQCTMEIGISTDADVPGFSNGDKSMVHFRIRSSIWWFS